MNAFWQDVRYGIRALARGRGGTWIAVLTLAAGIGASTAIFSMANAFLFSPLPVRDPGRLVVVAVHDDKNSSPGQVSNPDFLDLAAHNQVASDMTAFLVNYAGMSAGRRGERILATYARSNYFSALGIEPALGRFFLPGEGDTPGTAPVVVLSYAYWTHRFNRDAAIVGKSVNVNGRLVTVVGVAPRTFFGTFYIFNTDAYLPLGMMTSNLASHSLLSDRRDRQLRVLAHLKPGVSIEQARAGFQVIADNLARAYPESDAGLRVDVVPERLARPDPSAASALPAIAAVFLGLVGLVLLVTCLNIANLLLLRATLRAKEMAVRAGLGASRLRLSCQLITESLLLAGLGGIGGAALGAGLMRAIEAIRVPGFPALRNPQRFDWRLALFVALAAGVCGLLAGLAPAWRATRLNLSDALRESGRGMAGAHSHRLRDALVVAQVAGSLVTLIVSGLFLRSLLGAEKAPLGFNPAHVENFTMDTQELGYDQARGAALYREIEKRVRALPGVQAAAFAYSTPLGYYGSGRNPLWNEAQRGWPASRVPAVRFNQVGTDYFRTMGVEIVLGRGFDQRDGATTQPVAVVNEYLAQRLWPGQDPLGHHFRRVSAQGPEVEVVGVARYSKTASIGETPGPYFYVPLEQNYTSVRVLHVRSALPEAAITRAVEAQIHRVDANLPVFDPMSMTEALGGGNGYLFPRLAFDFGAALAALSLMLAVAGMYGVIASAVGQREAEIGVRLALGAKPRSILGLVLGHGLKLIAAGVLVGTAMAAGLARIVAGLLVNTAALDAITYATAAALLAGVAALACYLPARRALRVDPIIALRGN